MSLAWQVSMNILHKWETPKRAHATASVVNLPVCELCRRLFNCLVFRFTSKWLALRSAI